MENDFKNKEKITGPSPANPQLAGAYGAVKSAILRNTYGALNHGLHLGCKNVHINDFGYFLLRTSRWDPYIITRIIVFLQFDLQV